MNKKKYVVVDIETTWLSRYNNRITEIAAVVYDGNKIVNEFETFINPETHIPTWITRLTGITNEMVANAPLIENALPEFIKFLWDNILVAHNASFDMWFLRHNSMTHLDLEMENHVLCTRRLASRLLQELPKKNLWMICDHFELTNMRAHRAMADTQVTAVILGKFLNMLKERWISDKEDILDFQTRKISNCLM